MNAVERFQKQNNLTVDGKIGINTFKMMLKLWNKTSSELSYFLGHGEIESGFWKKEREDLRYSKEQLIKVFGKKYFPTLEIAKEFEFKPEKIANYVYDDNKRDSKHKLGNINIGDGWKFRGNACGITGKTNHLLFSKYVNNPEIMINPDLIWQNYFFESFLWFFTRNNIWSLCEEVSEENIKKTTLKVNGGYEGLDKRRESILKYWNLSKNKN